MPCGGQRGSPGPDDRTGGRSAGATAGPEADDFDRNASLRRKPQVPASARLRQSWKGIIQGGGQKQQHACFHGAVKRSLHAPAGVWSMVTFFDGGGPVHSIEMCHGNIVNKEEEWYNLCKIQVVAVLIGLSELCEHGALEMARWLVLA